MSGYRQPDEQDPPRRLALSTLAPETLRRVDRTTRGDGCVLLAQRPALLLSPETLALLLVLGVVLTCAVLVPRFGRLEPPRFSGTTRTMMLGGGLLSLTAGAALTARRWRLRRAMGVDPGVYVLARDLLDVRSSQAIVRPLAGLSGVTDEQTREQGHGVRLTFDDGATYVLPCYGTNATRLTRDIAELRTALDQAHEVGKPERLLWLDPFHNERARWSRGAQPTSEPTEGRSFRLSWAVVAAPVVAALLSGPVLSARDRLSVSWGMTRARLAGDDEALRRFAEEGGPMSDEVDRVRLRMALDDGSPEALTRYIRRGGRSPAVADDALLAAVAADGSLASLDRYLSLGQRHRDRILEQLLARGIEQADSEALRVYERHRGPRAQEVTAAYLPRARMLDPTQTPLPTRDVRGYLDPTVHPMARDTAEKVLRQRIDQRIAQLPERAPDGVLDARSLLLAVRGRLGALRLIVRRNEPQRTELSWPPVPNPGHVDSTHNFCFDSRVDNTQFAGFVTDAVASALEQVFEPGLLDLRRAVDPDPIPELWVEFERGAMPTRTAWALPGGFDLPVRVTLSLREAPDASQHSLTVQTSAHIEPPRVADKAFFCPFESQNRRSGSWTRLAPPHASSLKPLALRGLLRAP